MQAGQLVKTALIQINIADTFDNISKNDLQIGADSLEIILNSLDGSIVSSHNQKQFNIVFKDEYYKPSKKLFYLTPDIDRVDADIKDNNTIFEFFEEPNNILMFTMQQGHHFIPIYSMNLVDVIREQTKMASDICGFHYSTNQNSLIVQTTFDVPKQIQMIYTQTNSFINFYDAIELPPFMHRYVLEELKYMLNETYGKEQKTPLAMIMRLKSECIANLDLIKKGRPTLYDIEGGYTR